MDVVKVLLFTALFLCWTSQVLSQSVSVSAAQLGEWRSCMLVQPLVPALDRYRHRYDSVQLCSILN